MVKIPGYDLTFSEPKTFSQAAALLCPGKGFWHEAARAILTGALHNHIAEFEGATNADKAALRQKYLDRAKLAEGAMNKADKELTVQGQRNEKQQKDMDKTMDSLDKKHKND